MSATPEETKERLDLMLFGISSMRDLILKLPPRLYTPEEIAEKMDAFMEVVRDMEDPS